MHIPPVHNCCALDFVIGGICGKSTDSKVELLLRSQDANFAKPLYTKRAAVD
jgi:hypothetical protein